tara:strand:+ start:3221 stop:3454 length:234 start_codon:yes stop_codon:yes gene_type:complete
MATRSTTSRGSKSTTATKATARTTAATKNLQAEVNQLKENYSNLQRRLGGLRYHIAQTEGISTDDVIRLIDNVIEAS